MAAVLIILERFGRAELVTLLCVMLCFLCRQEMGGFGRAFGVHEALDQFGAICAPLAAAESFLAGYRSALPCCSFPEFTTLPAS